MAKPQYKLGDIAVMYNRNSPYYKEGKKRGTGTHTGHVVGYTPAGEPIIEHYIGGPGSFDKSSLLRSRMSDLNKGPYRISQMLRPPVEYNPNEQCTPDNNYAGCADYTITALEKSTGKRLQHGNAWDLSKAYPLVPGTTTTNYYANENQEERSQGQGMLDPETLQSLLGQMGSQLTVPRRKTVDYDAELSQLQQMGILKNGGVVREKYGLGNPVIDPNQGDIQYNTNPSIFNPMKYRYNMVGEEKKFMTPIAMENATVPTYNEMRIPKKATSLDYNISGQISNELRGKEHGSDFLQGLNNDFSKEQLSKQVSNTMNWAAPAGMVAGSLMEQSDNNNVSIAGSMLTQASSLGAAGTMVGGSIGAAVGVAAGLGIGAYQGISRANENRRIQKEYKQQQAYNKASHNYYTDEDAMKPYNKQGFYQMPIMAGGGEIKKQPIGKSIIGLSTEDINNTNSIHKPIPTPVRYVKERIYNAIQPGIYPTTLKEAKPLIKDVITGYNRFTDRRNDYSDLFKELDRADKENDFDKAKEILNELDTYTNNRGEDDKYSEDAWAKYLGLPQRYNSITPSKYIPTKALDKSTTYYSLPNDIKENIRSSYLNGYIKPGVVSEFELENSNSNARVLGNFILDKGIDENGEYISYYDKYDLDPTIKGIGKIPISKFIGTPYEFYDRIYINKRNFAGGGEVGFNSAFAKARRSGLKEFEWKGKRYTTQLKEEVSNRQGNMLAPVEIVSKRETPQTVAKKGNIETIIPQQLINQREQYRYPGNNEIQQVDRRRAIFDELNRQLSLERRNVQQPIDRAQIIQGEIPVQSENYDISPRQTSTNPQYANDIENPSYMQRVYPNDIQTPGQDNTMYKRYDQSGNDINYEYGFADNYNPEDFIRKTIQTPKTVNVSKQDKAVTTPVTKQQAKQIKEIDRSTPNIVNDDSRLYMPDYSLQPVVPNIGDRDRRIPGYGKTRYAIDNGDINIPQVEGMTEPIPNVSSAYCPEGAKGCSSFTLQGLKHDLKGLDQSVKDKIYGDAWQIIPNLERERIGKRVGGIDWNKAAKELGENPTREKAVEVLNREYSRNRDKIRKVDYKENDILELQYFGSDNYANSTTDKDASFNTHTGRIVKENGKLYVYDYTGLSGKINKKLVHKRPLDKVLNDKEDIRIVGVGRLNALYEGSKEKYYDPNAIDMEIATPSGKLNRYGALKGKDSYIGTATIEKNREQLKKNFGLTDEEFKALKEYQFATGIRESKGGQEGNLDDKLPVAVKDLIEFTNAKKFSRGYSNVVWDKHFTKEYRKATGLHEEENPKHSALASFSVLADNLNRIKELNKSTRYKIPKNRMYDLAVQAYNYGFNEDIQNILSNYYKTGDSKHLDAIDKYEHVKSVKAIKSNFRFKKAYGGDVDNVPIEVEGGEVGIRPDGSMKKYNGPTHEGGGIPTNEPEGSFIYSDRILVDKNILERFKDFM